VIIQLLIIEDLVKRTGKQVPELFDFIAGTSAGAGNAALYAARTPDGKHLYTADEFVEVILQQYRESHIPTWHLIKTLYGLIGPRYSTDLYRKRTQKIFKDTTLCNASPPLVIPVCNAITHETIILTTANAKKDPSQNFKLSDVVGAAMAFPGVIEPIRMKTQSGETVAAYDSGGLHYNPALLSLSEARNMLKEEEKEFRSSQLEKIHLVTLNSSLTKEEKEIQISNILKERFIDRINILGLGSGLPEGWRKPSAVSGKKPAIPQRGLFGNIKLLMMTMFQSLDSNVQDGVKAAFADGDGNQKNYHHLEILLKTQKGKKSPFVVDDTDPYVIGELIRQTKEFMKTQEYLEIIHTYFGDDLRIRARL